jgi:hypothetical protein
MVRGPADEVLRGLTRGPFLFLEALEVSQRLRHRETATGSVEIGRKQP